MKIRLLLTITISLLLLSGCATPEPDPFQELDRAIAAGEFGEITSLLIWQGDELRHEAYYRGANSDEPVQVYSVTKSVIAALVGMAMNDGFIGDVTDPAADYLPEGELPPRFSGLTLEAMLTMRAGIEWDELSTIYGQAENDATQLANSQNWLRYILDKRLATEPGTTFAYNSGVSYLLGVILARSTGESVETYAARNLFAPLGIEVWDWEVAPDGYANGGWGLYLRPADMLKIGRLYLAGGVWEGAQIVPTAWVTTSGQAHTTAGPEYDYGYQWWRFNDNNPAVADLEQNDLFFAWGFGGNFIFIVPHLELVVVATATNFADSSRFFPALAEYIFPVAQ